MIKKLIYNVFKYPLIIIFLKTPLIKILKKRFKFHRSRKNNIFWHFIDTIFQREYFDKLKDEIEIRKLTDSTLINGEGEKWAEHYYKKHFKELNVLKSSRFGNLAGNEALPIFEKIISFIKNANLETNREVYILQLGSSSGRDLEFFIKIFPQLNYISTDINNEILNFQRKKYDYSNLYYYRCYAEEIDKCINHFSLDDKKILLFSTSSLQYVNPFFLRVFFSKIKKFDKLDIFINEPVSLDFINNSNEKSKYRGNTSYSHKYDAYAKEAGIQLIEHKIVKPYSSNDKNHWDTCHSYTHAKSLK